MDADRSNQHPFWNEFDWEAHLNEIEKRSEQLRKFITSDPKENVPRWISLLKDSHDELDAVESFIEEELLFDEAYFPEDEDDWEDEDEADDDLDILFSDEEDEDEEDLYEGEDWKELSGDYTYSDYGSIDHFEVYQQALDLSVDVLRWAEVVMRRAKPHQQLHDFVSAVLQVGAKLAGGYSFGFELDVLGGNIAYTKKALTKANEALNILYTMKKDPLLPQREYLSFSRNLFEIRNETGVYVQELRDRFKMGLD